MPRISRKKAAPLSLAERTFDARPDTIDFRDKMYQATLVEVPIRMPLEHYVAGYPRNLAPILNQGREGACSGFGLAAVANYLLRRRKVVPDSTPVSPRMLYEMARRYDEWPGENYSGSSARGAMKGWHKHGVCSEAVWPYETDDPEGTLTFERGADAARRPLGAYFRVNHLDLVALHSALAEVGILYVTASVHEGWGQLDAEGVIPPNDNVCGGHAFALVGYDDRGFWLQNSWGLQWGRGGFGLLTYEDWLANGTDVWVARLGAPVQARARATTPSLFIPENAPAGHSFQELRPHVISLGNHGQLRSSGTYATTAADVHNLFAEDLPRLTADWPQKRLLLYAHGGLVNEAEAIHRVADYRPQLLAAHVYPLSFVWHSDFWTTLGNILREALGFRRPEGLLDAAQDFMLDRLDDTLEPLVRPLGKPLWDKMKENAQMATSDPLGGARWVLTEIGKLVRADPSWEVHVAAHSAGSIFVAPLIQALCGEGLLTSGPASGLTGLQVPVTSCTLWAPACTMKLFQEAYAPSIQSQRIRRFALCTLKDNAEQDDHCANLYHKSLLYLVSQALEARLRVFGGQGEPLLGLETSILREPGFQVDASVVGLKALEVVRLFGMSSAVWVRCPNGLPAGSRHASQARRHGDFDDDGPTVQALLAQILDTETVGAEFPFQRLTSALRDRRKTLAEQLQ